MMVTDLDRKARGLMWVQHRDIHDRRSSIDIVCFGAKGHFRKDGMCKHTAGVLASMKPWYRARSHVRLFGYPGRPENAT